MFRSHFKSFVTLDHSETFISNESDIILGVLTKGIVSVETDSSYSVNGP